MTTTTIPSVPVPAGATPDIWEGDDQPYRVIHGASRGVSSRDDVDVATTAVQFADGTISDGSNDDPPFVFVNDQPFTTAQARELVSAILECINELDGWATR